MVAKTVFLCSPYTKTHAPRPPTAKSSSTCKSNSTPRRAPGRSSRNMRLHRHHEQHPQTAPAKHPAVNLAKCARTVTSTPNSTLNDIPPAPAPRIACPLAPYRQSSKNSCNSAPAQTPAPQTAPQTAPPNSAHTTQTARPPSTSPSFSQITCPSLIEKLEAL